MERPLPLKIFFFGFLFMLFGYGQAKAQTTCFTSISIEKTDETCPGAGDGTVKVAITGGVPNYVYELQKRSGIASYSTVKFSSETPEQEFTFVGGVDGLKIGSGGYRVVVYDPQISKDESPTGNACIPITSDPFLINTTGTTPPDISIDGKDLVCEAQRGVFYEVPVTAGSSYTWDVPDGATIISGQGTNKIRVDFGSSSGSVSVVETNDGGCSGKEASFAVEVVSKPKKFNLVALSATTFCAGEPGPEIILDNSQEGVTYYLYTLPDLDIVKTVESTTEGDTISFGHFNQAGEYAASAYTTRTDAQPISCSAGGMIGSVILNPITLSLTAKITDVVCKGEESGSIDLSVSGGSSGSYGYAWSNGATTQDIEKLAAGSYTVTVTDPIGCTIDSTFTIKEPAEKLAGPTVEGPAVVCEGQEGVEYQVVLTSGSSYSWSVPVGATIVSGESGPGNNEIQVNFGSTSGNISVTETNSSGCSSTTSTFAVEVKSEPKIFTLSPNGATTFCKGENGPEMILSGSEAGISYTLWKNDTVEVKTIVGTEGEGTLNFGSYDEAGVYKVNAFWNGVAGCEKLMDGTIKVIVNEVPAPPTPVGAILPVCVGGDVPVITLEGDNIIIYSDINLTNQVGSGNTFDPESDPAFSTTTAGTITYYATQQLNGCTSEAFPLPIPIIKNPEASFTTSALAICQKEDVSLQVELSGVAPFDLTYELEGEATTITGIESDLYSIDLQDIEANVTVTLVKIKGSTGCEQLLSESATVTVNPLPAVTFGALSDDVCIDEPAFALTGGAPAGGTYSGTGVNSSTGMFDPAVALEGDHPITYTFTDANGCTNFAVDTITVNALPVVSLGTFDDVCVETKVLELTGGTPVGGIYSGPGVIDSIESYFFKPSVAGLGTHTITYSFSEESSGCENFAKSTITVNPIEAPTLDVSVTETEVCAGTPVTFTANVSNPGTNPTYEWYLNGVLVPDNNRATYTRTEPADEDEVYLKFTQGSLECGTGEPLTSPVELITVNPLPTATIADDATICTGGSATLTFNFTGEAPYEVRYSDGTDTLTLSSATASLEEEVSPGATTTYTIISVADENCSQAISNQSATVTVNETLAPQVSISPETIAVCKDTEVTFTASPVNPGTNATYSWYKNNELVLSGIDETEYVYSSPANEDSVYVVLTQGTLTCGTGATVTSNKTGIKVEPTPDATFTGPTAVCLADESVTYSPTEAGGSFTASVPGVISTDGTFSPDTAGEYSIYYSISSALGCTAKDTLIVQVNPIDSISVALGVNQTEACGPENEFTFTANITNGGVTPQIRWFIDEVEQVGHTEATFVAENLPADSVLNVRVEVSQDATSLDCVKSGSVDSDADSLKVTVYPLPVATLNTSDATTICAGETVNLEFSLTGTAPFQLSYTNGIDTTSVSETTEHTLLITVQPTESQSYKIVSFSDASGCSSTYSGEVGVTVNKLPADAPENLQATTIACSEISVQWDGTANSESYQIRWSEDATFASGVQSDTLITTTTNIGALNAGATYYIELTALNSCGAAAVNAVTSITLPAAVVAPENIVITEEKCDSFTAAWDSVAGAERYLLDLATDAAFENFVEGYQAFSLTDTTQVLGELEARNYYLRLRAADSCDTSQNSAIIQIDLSEYAMDSLAATVTNVKCAGDSTGSIAALLAYYNETAVAADETNFTFLWNTGATTNSIENQPAGQYWVEVTNAAGCSLRDTFQITQPQAIVLNTTQQDVWCNSDSTGMASVVISGGVEPYTMVWTNSNAEVVANDTTHIYELVAGQYFVAVIDANNCVARDTVTITQPEQLSLTSDIQNVSCASDSTGSIEITVAGGAGSYRFVWHTLSVPEDQNLVTNLPAGEYPVTIYDAANCSISDTLEIISTHPAVVVNLGPDRCENESVILDAGFDVADYDISWSTGETSQTITVTESGDYIVQVTNRTSSCVGTDTVNINIGEPLVASVELDVLEEESCSSTEFVVVANAANAGAAPVYEWFLNANSLGVDNDTLRLSSFAAGDTIRVLVQPDASNSCVSAESTADTMLISMPWLQAPNIEADQLEACGGQPVKVAAEGENIRWYLNEVSEATFLYQGDTLVHNVAEADTIKLLATQQFGSCNIGPADTVEVFVRQTLAPVLPEDISRCGNEALPVVTAEGQNIRWYADAALSRFINQGNTLALSALTGSDRENTDTTFYATQTIEGCVSPAESVTISTKATPVVNLGPDIVRCSPAEVVLNAGYEPADGYTIEWVDSGSATQTDTVTRGGNYMVRVTHNDSGCTVEDEIFVIITDEITSRVDIEPVNELNCSTGNLQLEAEVTNLGESPTYSWYLNGTLVEGETAALLTLDNYSDQDSVSVRVDVDLDCAIENPVSNYFIVEMPTLNPVVLNSSAGTVCVGEENPLLTASGMLEGSMLRWYKGAVHPDSLVAQGTANYLPAVSEAGTYTYFVTQSTARCGASEASSIAFTINGAADCTPACEFNPTASIGILPGTELCADITNIQLQADTLEVGPNASYTWYYAGTEIGTGISLNFARPAEGFADGAEIGLVVQINDTEYICEGVGTIESTETITISGEDVPATLDIVDQAVCFGSGEELTFSATGTYIDWRAQGLSTSIYWYLNGELRKTAKLEPGSDETALQFTIGESEIREGDLLRVVAALDESLGCIQPPVPAEYVIEAAEVITPSVTLYSSAGAEGVCSGTDITFTASAINAGASPIYTWYVQAEGGAAEEMQSGRSNTYTHAEPLANEQVWVEITADASAGICYSGSEVTATAFTIVLKSEEECDDDGGGDGGSGEFNCNTFSIELVQKEEPSCDQNNGYLQYSVTGGASPYTIRYTFTETSIPEVLHGDTVIVDIDNIPANTYGSISIVDAEGNSCSLDSISLPMAPRIAATLSKPEGGDVTCYGEQMGRARLEITGGTEPFQYKLNEEEEWRVLNRRFLDLDSLPAGLTSVLVRDNDGDECMTSATVDILSLYPPLEIVSFETEDANCNDNIGKIWVNGIRGGNGGPYKVKLQNEESFREFDPAVPFEGLSRGTYNVVITDGVCERSQAIRVGSPGLIAIDYELIPYDCANPDLKAGIYANLNADLTEVEGPYEASISKMNEAGEYVVVPGLEAVRFTQGELFQYNLDNGTYAIEVRTVEREGCPENISGIVIEDSVMPTPITFTHSPENIYCVDAVGGVTITEMAGARNAAYIISIYQDDQLVEERTVENDEYVVNNGLAGVYQISGLPAGIYRMMIRQEQGGCEGMEVSEAVSFKIEENPSMLYAEVVEKTKSFPERGSGKLRFTVQTNSGQEPYLSSIYLVEPLFPAQQYISEGDTVRYDPIEATFDHTYDGLPAGTYELYVSDANGCTFFIQDTIAYDESLFIPNVITPNNDGYNEAFYVRNIPPTGTRLIITNRWGKVVYSTKNYQNDWTGADMEDGIYFYHLLVAEGEKIEMKGWVEIRRGTRP